MHKGVIFFLLYFLEFLCARYVSHASPPPVKNFTTITFYTDSKTWNDAARICADHGGKLLDITYYSFFNIILSLTFEDPWKDLLIGNGLAAWISLHRRVTPLGDNFYSKDCQRLSDFQVAYWNTSSPYSVMSGDATSYCVYDQIYVTTINEVTTAKHGYTRAHCDELHQFYCMSESGPCTFEEVDGYYGDSSNDLTDNDIIYPYESDDKCAQLCLNSSSEYPYTGLRVVEECWGFSTSISECRLHIVVKPTYFNKLPNRIASVTRTLFIKRCFANAVNNQTFDVGADTSVKPESMCGIPTFVNSTVSSLQVFVYYGVWTWNEAYTTCKQNGLKLLEIQTQDDYLAIGQLVDVYDYLQRMDYIWIGLHEPDPINHTDIRVWSDCGESKSSNWDPNSPPSSDLSDTSLCVVLDTRTNYWYTTKCNDMHYFICTGDYGSSHSYSNGLQYTMGLGVSIGPYNVTEVSCKDMCSTLTYNDQECWGFAVLQAEIDTLTYCHLFFTNNSYTNISIFTEPSTEPYIFHSKLIWSDTLMLREGDSDYSLVPKSCCDVSGIMSECPDNNVPDHSASIPTTEKVEFVLYTAISSWNEALSACSSVGGTLLQVDDASKRHMLQRYVNAWITDGDLTGDLWIGLSQLHSDDPCSLRWASDCSLPDWTDFTDPFYTADINNYCTVINNNMKFVKRPCDMKLQFVCEMKIGPCDMLDVLFDIDCSLGPYGSLQSVPLVTCLADCHSVIKDGTECWAAVKTGPFTCNLVFGVDPGYCKENNVVKNGYEVFFKSCFSASVFRFPPLVSNDSSVLPNTPCLDLMPTDLSDQLCYTTTTTTITTTSTVSTSSISWSTSSTESQSPTTSENSLLISSVSPLLSFGLTTTPLLSPSTSEQVSSMTSISTPTSSESNATYELSSTSSPVTSTTSILPSVSFESSTTSQSSSAYSTTVSPEVETDTISSLTTLSVSTESANSTSFTYLTTCTTNNVSTTTLLSISTLSSALSTSQFTKPLFIMPCLCNTFNKSKMTISEWNEWFALSNTVAKQNISRYRRKLTSISDKRKSSLTIGIIASVVFIALAIYIITTDIPIIMKSMAYIHGMRSATDKVMTKYKSNEIEVV